MHAFRLIRYEPEVGSELFRLGHRNMPANVISAITLRTLMVLATWNIVPHERIFFWLAVSAPSIVGSLVLWWVFRHEAARQAPTPPAQLRRWIVWHAVCMCLLGLSAGSIGVLFGFNPHLDLLIGCAFVGIAAYSVAGNATHDLLAFFLTILTGGLAMSFFIPNAFGDASVYMIAMTWLYMSILSIAANNSHGTVVNSIRLRLANAALAERNARSAALAEQANRDKSEFLAAASHDLRQPVHALLLFVEALRQNHQGKIAPRSSASMGQDQDMLIEQIASAGQAISTMFNELMELSRLESGAEKARIHPVALAPLLQQCVDSLQMLASQKDLHLRLRIGRSARAAVVQTDRALLARTVSNLLSNAVRYTERGGVLLTLRQRPGHRLELAVHDTGIGIAPSQHQRIFEPYVQVGNPERDRSKGLGLGLAIVRQCLRLLGLEMHLHSTVGHGSRFWIGFDQWRTIEQAPAPVPQADALVVRSLAGRRVLLIDDDAMVRTAMQTVLGSWGVELRSLSAIGDEKLQALADDHWRPDCILCDYRMPGPRNGIDILDALTDVFPGAVGVLQTGERAEQVQSEADDAGYVVLYKPVGAAALASTMAAVLRSTGPAPLNAHRGEGPA
jgi:signal transduction histidine kinase/CheY-like chemotaxis protein